MSKRVKFLADLKAKVEAAQKVTEHKNETTNEKGLFAQFSRTVDDISTRHQRASASTVTWVRQQNQLKRQVKTGISTLRKKPQTANQISSAESTEPSNETTPELNKDSGYLSEVLESSGEQAQNGVREAAEDSSKVTTPAGSCNFPEHVVLPSNPKEASSIISCRRNLFNTDKDDTGSEIQTPNFDEDWPVIIDDGNVLELQECDFGVINDAITGDLPITEAVVLIIDGDRTIQDGNINPVNIQINQVEAEEDQEAQDSDPGSENAKKRTRKRKQQPTTWKKNIAKAKLNSGEEHVNMKGRLIPGRKIGEPCDESCRNACSQKISEEARQQIFKEFWNTPDRRSKWEFLARHVKSYPKKSGNQDENSKRLNSRIYTFRYKGEEIKVCKIMFLSTLDICDGWIKTCFKKLGDGAHISPDKRGADTSGGRKVNASLKECVREHIRGFPRMPSHYTRDSSTREYLTDEVQNVSELHEAFVDWMKEKHPEEPVADYRQYLDIFNYEFNISFFVSKKDLCDLCEGYRNETDPKKKEEMEQKIVEHNKDNTVAQTMRLADLAVAKRKTSTNLCVACFDYQKSLNSPKAKASIFYYRRKLGVNNFTVVDSGRSDDLCYVYDETTGGKGSNEVASFMFNFIERKVEAGVTDFRFYSDNCVGQNKNRAVLSMYLSAAAKFNIVIKHRFLETGHTYNSADTVHSVIETKSRPRQIFSPQEWYKLIAVAKKKKNPIKVIEVKQEMIHNWKDLIQKLKLDTNIDGEKIPWTRIREFSVGGQEEHNFQYKVKLEGDSKTVSTKAVGRPVNLKNYVPPRAYENPLPISKAKYQDLKYYCDNRLIPIDLHEFYLSLPWTGNAGPTEEETEAAPAVDIEQEDKPSVQGRARKRRARKPKAAVPKKRSKSQRNVEQHESSEDEV